MNTYFKMLVTTCVISSVYIGNAFAQQTIKIDGSSTVFPPTELAAEQFMEKQSDVKVMVAISGTGGGFKKFCKGETDISNASRPILKKELDECAKNGIQFIELPIAFDAVTIVTSKKNSFLKKITVAELKKLWEPAAQANIVTWNQVNPAWPKTPIKLFAPGQDSGTFDYFTEAIVGKSKMSRTDYFASEDDNVLVQGIARNANGLGYMGFAYFSENQKQLVAVPVVHTEGKNAVLPSIKTVMDTTYQPLARPLFIYVNAKAIERPELKEFVSYYLKNGAKIMKEVKYIPLNAADYQHAQKNFNTKKVGTAFSGQSEVGVTIAELLKRDPKS
jgi:phosphate transport system substrate-binding protein